MARQWRIEYEGAIYHVLSRGNDGQNIFEDDRDRELFLEILSEMSERFDLEIYSYVLMSNHYHILLKTNKANISKCMQWLGTTYTRRYNLKNKRSGHLFQGRYKTFLVENEKYLLQVSCYIHRNPLRAGIMRRLADYRWSSYTFYAYKMESPLWLSTDMILSNFHCNERHKAYREMVQHYAKEEKKIWENLQYALVFGSKEFIGRIRNKYLTEERDKELPQKRHILKESDPEKLILKASCVLKINAKKYLYLTKRVRKEDKCNRDLLIYLLWSTCWYSNQQIGELFGIGFSSISRRVAMMKNSILEDDELKKKFEKIKSIINRLSENTNFQKSAIENKGVTNPKKAKEGILGQPVKV